MDSRTFAACVATSKPLTMGVPASALSSVDRIRPTVVLPAPFEPSKAKMVPRSTSKSTPFRTSSSLYDFSRPCTRIAGSWTRLTVISKYPFFLLRSSNRDVAIGRSRADRRALDVRTGFGGAVQLAADLAVVGPQVEVCGGAGGDA